jgi:hypothetical protein
MKNPLSPFPLFTKGDSRTNGICFSSEFIYYKEVIYYGCKEVIYYG